jgi:hypothetical protein
MGPMDAPHFFITILKKVSIMPAVVKIKDRIMIFTEGKKNSSGEKEK